MCLNPKLIPNKNYRRLEKYSGWTTIGEKFKHITYQIDKGQCTTDARYYKDHLNTHMAVPCKHCKECITKKQMDYVQRIVEESQKNEVYMVTLTYKNDMIRTINVNGYKYMYADITDWTNLVKRFDKWRKEENKEHNYIPYPFRYFGITELGGKKGRPHIHLLIFIDKKYLPDRIACLNAEPIIYWAIRKEWCRNIGSKRKPIYKPLFEYHERYRNGRIERNYDCHYVRPEATEEGMNNAAWYIMKYMLKDAPIEERRNKALKINLKPGEYENIWQIIRTKRFYSTYFGINAERNPFGDIEPDKDIEQHIKWCIEESKRLKLEYPCWFNPINGKSFPLCEYYKKYFLTLEDIKYWWNEEYATETHLKETNQAQAQRTKFERLKRQNADSIFNQITNYLNN